MQAIFAEGAIPVVRISKGDSGYPLLNGINSALPGFNTVTLSGYLVDCATGPCDAIVP